MLTEVPLTCGRCAHREEIAVFRFTDPDLAPVIAHLQAEASRKRARASLLSRFSVASTFDREASALERAAEILSRHV